MTTLNPTDSGVTERLEPPERIWIDIDEHALSVRNGEAGHYFVTPDKESIEYVRASVAAPPGDAKKFARKIIDAVINSPCVVEVRMFSQLEAVDKLEDDIIALLVAPSTTQAGEVSAAPVVDQWLNEIESACNSALLDVYDQSIANAPVTPDYARGTADCIAHRVGQIREAIAAIRAAAPLAAPVANDAEELARQIVGTVFDNTGASHETLKQVMIKRITDAIVVGHISLPAPTLDAARRAANEIAFKINGGESVDLSYPKPLVELMDNPTIANEAALAQWLEAIISKHCPAVVPVAQPTNVFDYMCDAQPNCGWRSTNTSRPLGRGIKVGCPNCLGDARFIGITSAATPADNDAEGGC